LYEENAREASTALNEL